MPISFLYFLHKTTLCLSGQDILSLATCLVTSALQWNARRIYIVCMHATWYKCTQRLWNNLSGNTRYGCIGTENLFNWKEWEFFFRRWFAFGWHFTVTVLQNHSESLILQVYLPVRQSSWQKIIRIVYPEKIVLRLYLASIESFTNTNQENCVLKAVQLQDTLDSANNQLSKC